VNAILHVEHADTMSGLTLMMIAFIAMRVQSKLFTQTELDIAEILLVKSHFGTNSLSVRRSKAGLFS
jgi:hypothetical protein